MKPTRREFLGVTAAAALPAWGSSQPQRHRGRRPNVVVLLVDDLGPGDLGCYGNNQVNTPNIDRMHGESVRFTNFYVQPLCSPTRASLLTGRYCFRGGVIDTWVGVAMLRPDEVTLAQALSEGGGYRTGLFGKWHLGDHYPLRPNDRGFQETLTFESGVIGQTGGPPDNPRSNPTLLHNGKHEQYQGYCTDIFFDEAMRFIEANRDQPFFVYLPTQSVHLPLDVPERYAAPFVANGVSEEVAKLYGMVTNLDENVAKLFAKLQTLGLDQDTIVIFLSDNGPGDPMRFNAGLRGVKGQVYEGGIKVPCFIRWPGRLSGNRDVSSIAAHIDLFPTVLDICGVVPPPTHHLDGLSLLPLAEGKALSPPDRMVFIQGCRPDQDGWDVPRLYANASARGQQYKIVMASPSFQNDFPTAKTFSSAATMRETELYDLDNDPGEQHNIAAEHPDLVFKMRHRYETWFFDVMRGLNPPVQNHIGTSHENPVLLTAQDMRGPHALTAPWNWGQVHRMAKTEPAGAGYYELQVAREGRYRFTLSYGPPGNSGIPVLKQGTAFLGIAGIAEEKSIEAGAASVVFEIDLKAGGCRLEALFTGQRADQEAVAPFLVNVEYIQKRST